jgi:hypothetical protein
MSTCYKKQHTWSICTNDWGLARIGTREQLRLQQLDTRQSLLTASVYYYESKVHFVGLESQESSVMLFKK